MMLYLETGKGTTPIFYSHVDILTNLVVLNLKSNQYEIQQQYLGENIILQGQ